MNASLAEIAAAIGAPTPPNALHRFVDGVTTDSRAACAGKLFVALAGPRFDGHDFVTTALAQGAVAAVVSATRWAQHRDRTTVPTERLILVPDTLAALGAIGQWWRRQWGGVVAAVTGSAGKTTTKTLLASALAAIWGADRVWATPGNWNNAIGVPLTLCGIERAHWGAVVEVAMNQPGEIVALGRLAEPNVAVVLNALRAHLAGLGSLEAVAAEKGSLVTTLASDGVAVLPADSPFFAEWRQWAQPRRIVTFGRTSAARVRLCHEATGAEGVRFDVVSDRQKATVRLPWVGRHFAELASAALAVLDALQLPWEPAVAAWQALPPVAGRLRRLQTPTGTVVLDDTYNANPDAMRAAIDALMTLPQPRKVVVMGEMAELGTHAAGLHEEVGRYAKAAGVTHFLTLGQMAQAAASGFGPGAKAFTDLPRLLESLLPLLDAQTAILVKGSRVSHMERVVASIVPPAD
ncbi:UDP-N-acetylmuramoyl-tripeptide--D-alanyl-D-alanine ligase [Hydrogenophilus thiooxidans]|uniref:UDP-N-acetylmuramoyl-tripeptide--D-alanyl-D- alanine ligase n=1 Tax=Hydrogenophilus thiooxidans TaxID=2820326 RepID=UPI001C23859F|nr:UDP-N-acetylmuramoyl-tripeptide--D-alanyl-D-alanine ligase [Hydrogenophilus thiooxidans]